MVQEVARQSIEYAASSESHGSLSSRDGSIALSGRFERQDRTIKITATRSGTKIGEYSWRVEAVLR